MLDFNDKYRLIKGEIQKQCSICEEWFLNNSDNFYKKGVSTEGKMLLSPYCKTCETAKNRKVLTTNGKKKEYDKKYCNKPNIKEIRGERSKKQRLDGKVKEWQRNNPVKIQKYNKKYSNKKHTISLKDWIFCKDYFKNENGEWCCAYCGMTESGHKEKYNQQLHKEHVNCNGDGNLQNCVPSCRKCNDSKHTDDMKEWYKKQEFFSKYRLDKIYKWINEDSENSFIAI